jgi:hypothetical protein
VVEEGVDVKLENGNMDTKGTFKISLRNLLTILGLLGCFVGVYLGMRLTIAGQSADIAQIALKQDMKMEAFTAAQDARLQAIQVTQDVIKADIGLIKNQVGLMALAQQQFEVQLVVLKLQVQQLKESQRIGP